MSEVVVSIQNIPLRLWERTAAHNAELLREFSLIVLSEDRAAHPAPPLDLMVGLQARMLGIDESVAASRDTALAQGVLTQDLQFDAGPDAAETCTQLLSLLEAADDYCARGLLMTLPAPEEQRVFRRWYLGEFIRQVEGAPATPWTGPVD